MVGNQHSTCQWTRTRIYLSWLCQVIWFKSTSIEQPYWRYKNWSTMSVDKRWANL